MALYENIDPAELTGYSRTIAEAYDAQGSTLADILPTEPVDDVVFEWTVNERSSDLAAYRSWDTEAKIGSDAGGEDRIAKLAPLSLKKRIGEYEQVRRAAANAEEGLPAAVTRKATEVTTGITDRVILARGEALFFGRIAINERGLKQTVEFGRRAAFTKTAATLWSAAADVVKDLETWALEFATVNGVMPTKAVVSQRVQSAFRARAVAAGYFGTNANGFVVTNEQVNALLVDRGLPVFEVNERRAGGQRVIPDDRVLLTLPGVVGATPTGTTAESRDPKYNLEGDELTGLVTGVYESDDPKGLWVHGNAIALPILTNPDASLVAKVL
jgi:uncharacterized membrane protein YecN with MAPEG domain